MPDDVAFENGERVPVEPHSQFNYDELDENLPPEILDLINRKIDATTSKIVWEALTRYSALIMEHRDPDVTVTAFCFAAGLYILEGKSLTQLAKELSRPGRTITKQALSNRVVLITKQLDLPPSRGMKSEEARGKYREAQISRSKLP